jgi:hypothetical protein
MVTGPLSLDQTPRRPRWIPVLLLALLLAAPVWAAPERVLTLPAGPDNPRNSEGAFARLLDGRILFVYTRFSGDGEDHAPAVLASRISADGGRTWSTQDKVILAGEGAQNVMSTSLLRLQSGALALFYLRKNALDDCRPVMRVSNDDGVTWGAPRECTAGAIGYFVVNNDRVVQLASGRLLIPAARHAKQGEPFVYNGTALCFLSDDEGLTWRASAEIAPPKDVYAALQEPGVVELKDGRLWMFHRTGGGSQFVSYSTDAGATWSDAKPSALISPKAPASMKRLPQTGELLLVWNDHRSLPKVLTENRTPLVAMTSPDDGTTWDTPVVLEDNPAGWYCYTAIEPVDDAVLIGYAAKDVAADRPIEVRIVRVPLRDFAPVR